MTKQPKSPRKRKTSSARTSTKNAPRRWRTWLARLLTVVLAPTLFLAVVEGALWLFGYGYDSSYYIEAEDGKAYLSNPKFSRRFFGPHLARTPIPTVILPKKPENTYRVFVLGGSAAQGVPDPAFSFGRILEAMLNDRYRQTRFEVINTAMVAINSHVVLPIVKECGGFDGDLFIVYLGNNEVVGPYGAGTIFERPGASIRLTRASIYARSTRLGQLMGNTIGAIAGEDPEARKEWGGMMMFLDHRVAADDPRMKTVYDNFRANLDDICDEANSAGVPVIVSTVLSNLKDCPPFHSLHRKGLSDDDRARWEKEFEQGNALRQTGDYQQAAQRYQAAARIDDKYAELHFYIGQCHQALKQFDLARRYFVRARDLDALRFRADTQINQIIRRVAGNRQSRNIYLVDPEEVFRSRRLIPSGIPGWELLYEHVHLSFSGNYLVAGTVFEQLVPLLPAAIRKHAGGDNRPPSIARCRELTLYTDFNRFRAATKIAQITYDPPFPKTFAERSMAEAKRVEARLTPQMLRQNAAQYDRALKARPDDLLLRSTFALLQSIRDDHASAAEQYRELIGRYPHSLPWHNKLGVELARQGKRAEAVAKFRWVLQRDPNYVPALTELASSLAKTEPADEAIALYEQVLTIRPKDFTAERMLGQLHLENGRPQQAEKHFTTALQLQPDSPYFLNFFLGRALQRQGKLDRAVEHFKKEVSIHSQNPLPHLELAAFALTRNGPKGAEQAIRHYRRALELDPDLPTALNNLAWLYAACPQDHLRDGNRAVLLAERAMSIFEKPDATLLDTVAAAYAEAGQFAKAVETARRAIASAEQAGNTKLAAAIRRRLALYSAGKPWHD